MPSTIICTKHDRIFEFNFLNEEVCNLYSFENDLFN
jgi:hypothetical protein